eukprot:10896271-Karenia_brevis.AAC.1
MITADTSMGQEAGKRGREQGETPVKSKVTRRQGRMNVMKPLRMSVLWSLRRLWRSKSKAR